MGNKLVSDFAFKCNLYRYRKVDCPILLIHGDKDEVVPFAHSKKLRGSRRHYKVTGFLFFFLHFLPSRPTRLRCLFD